MNAFTRLGHLPLLVKELLEQAARPRTYWTRVAYGALLYLIVVVPQSQFFRVRTGDPASVLGQGHELFEMLVWFQFAGIFVFLPALMCGRITQEKERDSLVLLLLTELSPAQIILQKYIAGLVPMLSFLLLGLPLAAVAYAFGGFPSRDLALAGVTLLLACLQVGAISIWCSTICRNTAGAFMMTYVVAAIFYFGPMGGLGLLHQFDLAFSAPLRDLVYLHIPPAIFDMNQADAWNDKAFGRGAGVALATTLLFLLLAVFHLPRLAFAGPARLGRRFFAWLDSLLQGINRLFGNVVVRRPASNLPGEHPVLWRERRSRLMGRPAYLARLLFAVEVPVLLLVRHLGSSTDQNAYEQVGLSIFGASAGLFCVLALTVTAANAFVAERVSQTLEVLLTTSLPAQEIVRQKARALQGLVLVCAVPLLTIFGYEVILKSAGLRVQANADKDPAWVYALCSVLTVTVCLQVVKWLALWIGLATRTRLRAIAVALCVIVGWCLLPYLVLVLILEINPFGPGSWLLFASPLTVPVFNEMSALHEFAHGSPWLPVLVNFTLYGIVLHAIRTHCLAHADEYLRR